MALGLTTLYLPNHMCWHWTSQILPIDSTIIVKEIIQNLLIAAVWELK